MLHCNRMKLMLITGWIMTTFHVKHTLTWTSYNPWCYFKECCSNRWIVNNVKDLEQSLSRKLYGQHIAQQVVINHIRGHLNPKGHPAKALALIFLGPTGTGKTYTSRIIAEALYKRGMQSQFVTFNFAEKDFKHKHLVNEYKDKLHTLIETSVQKCPQAMFIFDEVDQMPSAIFDTISPYLDYHEHVKGVDYRHAIFIFIGNYGATEVTDHALRFFRDGGNREDIQLRDVEDIVAKSTMNSEGGLGGSVLISKHLITAYVPFLPLSREFVRRCILDVLAAKGHNHSSETVDEVVEEVMNELNFYPRNGESYFSESGCKRVQGKVDFVIVSVDSRKKAEL